KINQLSHTLVSYGVKPGQIIGVALPRSSELVITLLAIMRCGAAYLPLDITYPKNRLEFMLTDSEAQVLITTKNSEDISSNSNTLFIEDIISNLNQFPTTPLSLQIDNSQIAYILYTSGSTGKPKGVPISHKNRSEERRVGKECRYRR